jgi:hypothetical protein
MTLKLSDSTASYVTVLGSTAAKIGKLQEVTSSTPLASYPDNETHISFTLLVQVSTSLYNILIEFGLSNNLVRLIKMCLNETCSKVCRGKLLSDNIV